MGFSAGKAARMAAMASGRVIFLQRARVALVPGVAFGPTGEAHLRLCYARGADDVQRAFDIRRRLVAAA